MNIFIIILGIVVILLIYYIYKYATSKNVVNQANLNNVQPAILSSALTTPTSTSYAYSVWLYVNSWNNNVYKNIITTGQNSIVDPSTATTDGSSYPNFILYLDKNSSNLYCYINLQNGSSNLIKITTNLPLQKWVYIVVSVDTQYVDCYLDGKLVKSVQLPTSANVNGKDSVFLGNSGTTYDATLAQFTRTPNAVDPTTVWNNYLSGNGQSTMSSYGLQVDITKNNVTQNTWKLF
jgi:hypothetical protein